MRTPSILTLLALVTLVFSCAPSAFAQEPEPSKKKSIYGSSTNARADITAAVSIAAKDNQRVLIQYGADWCGWCHKLHELCTTNRAIMKALLYEYRVVYVDIGRFDKNMDVVEMNGANIRESGVPYLTVLDGEGKVVANQDTSSLQDGDKHDPEKVLAFIEKHKAAPRDAEAVLAAAKKTAAESDRNIFLHFGAPSCGWCHRLEAFLDRQSTLIAKDYVDVKIDIDRMTNGKAVEKAHRGDKNGGIPWWAIVSPDGKILATSENEKGANVGHPALPEEIAHFAKVIDSTSKRLNTEEKKALATDLEEDAKPKSAGH